MFVFLYTFAVCFVLVYGDYDIINKIVLAGDALIFVINIGPMVVGFSASCLTSLFLVLLIIKMFFEKEDIQVEDSNMQ